MTEPTTTETAQPTMADRVTEHGLTLTVIEGPRHRIEPTRGGRHGWVCYWFRVQLTTADGGRIVAEWRQGEAHGKATPEAADVLGSLVLDASCFAECRDLADFAANYCDPEGADNLAEGIREAQAAYDACRDVFDQLSDVFGDDGREALLYETERQ